MSVKHIIFISLIVSALVMAIFSWPLARHFSSGVPCSSTNVESESARHMVAGDHLQLLYGYWVFADMLEGQTPFFYNLYEFNTGDDEARRYVGFDFVPFTLLFALAAKIGGQAFGWNVTSFIAVWLTYLFTWLLVRRFTGRLVVSAVIAVLAIAFPYRWAAQLGGSPTGFAMLLVPLWLWGLDVAIREQRLSGGCVAGAAILFTYLNDAHVMLFSFLAIPFWALLCLFREADASLCKRHVWRHRIVALLPFALGCMMVLLLVFGDRGSVDNTTLEHGRSSAEIALFSPQPEGLFMAKTMGNENSIYIGVLLPVLLALGMLIALRRMIWQWRRTWRRGLVYLLLLAALSIAVILSLGPNGLGGGALFSLVRHLIPPYAMIRQPAKLFSLLPSVVALVTALSLETICLVRGKRWVLPTAACLIVLFSLVDYRAQVRPQVSLLDSEQTAYEAVQQDAKLKGRIPRAIALPIWPGDSAWSSLYQYYASLYRIRMINGYLPVVPINYIENVYTVYEYLNGGIVRDEALDRLLKSGFHYILLHEDAFPEQVGSFGVAFTLKQLLNAPRLELLHQGKNVWAFRILDRPVVRAPVLESWTTFFPSYNLSIELEQSHGSQCLPQSDTSASGGRFMRLSEEGSSVVLDQLYHCDAPSPTLALRTRGQGRLVIDGRADDEPVPRIEVSIDSTAWRWTYVALPLPPGSVSVEQTLSNISGTVDLDVAILSGGRLPELECGGSFELPAPLFFHAGYTDMSEACVVLRPTYEADGGEEGVFYGPCLPLSSGRYIVRVAYESTAESGQRLGQFYVTLGDARQSAFPVVAGSPAEGSLLVDEGSLPVRLAFNYSRAAEVRIHSVRFERVE